MSLNLQVGSYRPYTKSNADVKYVSTLSNHPPAVLQNIPDSINKRLNSISSNAECFNNEKGTYQKALTEAHHDYHLEYNNEVMCNIRKKKKRRRKVIWFNPPYS